MPKWTQRDGTQIEVTDMDDTHVANAMRMLGRKKHVMEVRWYLYLRNELQGRREQRNHDEAMEALSDPWGDD